MFLHLLIAATTIACDGAPVSGTTTSSVGHILEAASGGIVEFGPGVCYMGNGVKLDQFTVIKCAGQQHTTLFFNGDGIHAPRGVDIRDCKLVRPGYRTVDPTVGIRPEGWFNLEHITIEGFTFGLYGHASAVDFGTNINGWRARDVTIKGSGATGWYIRGRDAGGGSADGLRIYTSCEFAPYWETTPYWVAKKDPILGTVYGECAGLVERSMYGNAYNALIISTTHYRDAAGVYVPKRPYIFEGSQNGSVVTFAYRETDQLDPSLYDKQVTIIGGFSPYWLGAGQRIAGVSMSGFKIRNSTDPLNIVDLSAGNLAGGGSYLLMESQKAKALRMKAFTTQQTRTSSTGYGVDINNSKRVLMITPAGKLVVFP